MDIVALVISICALLVSLLTVRRESTASSVLSRSGLSRLARYAGAEEQYLNKNKDKKSSGVIDAADPNLVNAEWRNKTGQVEKDPLDFMKDVK